MSTSKLLMKRANENVVVHFFVGRYPSQAEG